MNVRLQKVTSLIIAAAALLAGIVLLHSSLKDYAHTIPVVIGPYKRAALILLTLIFVLSLGFSAVPPNKRTLFGTLCITLAVFWFTGKMLLEYRSPEHPGLLQLSRWMPVPLILFGAGTALWAGELQADRFHFQFSEKQQKFLALLLMFVAVMPILGGGFNWDDAFISVEAQAQRLTGESIFTKVWQEIVEYLSIGRINPFAGFHYLVFYFIPDAGVYKVLLAAVTLLNGFLFYRFLKRWLRDRTAALLILLAVPLCFQFRLYHDPLNSYYGLMQVMFCELMGALICCLRWLESGRKRFLVLSLIFFLMGLMSYEMFFPLTALFLIPALGKEKKLLPALRKILPWILAALLIFALSMLLRTNITQETAYNGTSFNFDIPLIFRTFFYQVTAAVPLRYRTSGYDAGLFGEGILWQDLFNTSLGSFISSVQWQDLLGLSVLILLMMTESRRELKFSVLGLLFGLLLWLLPGLVISLSAKYQSELHPGLAYIPVYFSYFGMAVILYELLSLSGRYFRSRTVRLVSCGAACMILLINAQDSRHINSMLNDVFLHTRKTGEAALQAGILGTNDTEGKTLISANRFALWENGWMREAYQTKFYSLNARTPIHAVGESDFVEQLREVNPGYITPYDTLLMFYTADDRAGFAKCGRLRGIGFDFENNELTNEMVSDVFLFMSGENQRNVFITYLSKDNQWNWMPIEEAWLIQKTKDGTLYKIPDNRPMRFDSIALIKRDASL